MHTNDHCLTATTKDEKWLVLVGRPSLAASGWRARRPAPPSYFHIKATKTLQALMRLALGVALLALAGCYPPSALETDYGNAVRNNVAQQVVNPRAGFNPKPAVGLPPQAAAGEMERYDKTFKEEPKKMEKQLDYQRTQ
ncbi:MAG: hypothetical protein FJ121_03960 [Deltaproteobacteria bacterium]|nr:hypothetical protein [Deltaproteobacteria bacterium]